LAVEVSEAIPIQKQKRPSPYFCLIMATTELRRVRRRTTSSSAIPKPLFDGVILIPLAELPTLATTITSTLAPSSASSGQVSQVDFPNLVTWAGFSPVLISVWNYSSFLGIILMLWVSYLLLPKGFRKQVFRAYPRRYKKANGKRQAVGHWVYAKDTLESAGGAPESAADRFTARMAARRPQTRGDVILDSREESSLRSRTMPIERQTSPKATLDYSRRAQDSSVASSWLRPGSSFGASSSIMTGKDRYYTGADSPAFGTNRDADTSSYVSFPSVNFPKNAPPSPRHPSIETVPNSNILSETMRRLKARGIRLIAHGVQCEPKRVWIKLDEDTYSLSWQTEFPRQVPNQLGEVSIVLMRGSIHKIALPNVLYIDVGKRTSALMRPDSRTVLDACCFSLLTQNGSLDLQTSSRLERDALVSCFSMILDQVHDRDWRNMYEEGSSIISSSVATNQFASDFVEI
jgi:hypothetical protein